MTKTILITGAAGFLGHHLVKKYLALEYRVIALVSMRFSGNLNRLSLFKHSGNLEIIYHNLECPFSQSLINQLGGVDIIIHAAAQPHVDRSIKNPVSTIMSNVMGTTHVLELARQLPNLSQFILFSTDEVFGPGQKTPFSEYSPHTPTNPYSGSKSASEMIATSYYYTYSLPISIIHSMNIYGEGQQSAALIPTAIKKILKEETFTLHVNSDNVGPSRCYTYVEDTVNSIMSIIDLNIKHSSKIPVYNIGSDVSIPVLDIVKEISNYLNIPVNIKLQSGVRNFVDVNYNLSKYKVKKLGLETKSNFFDKLPQVVQWYIDNIKWLS